MPLGDAILVDFPATGACVVHVPRVGPAQLENAYRNLLDQYASSGQFEVKREGEQTKTMKSDGESAGRMPGDDRRHSAGKLKYHFLAYSMSLPDIERSAELVLATSESQAVSFQGVLSFEIAPEKS